MNLKSTWTALRNSTSQEVVLCADFQTTGRAEAGFPDLVPMLRHDSNYWLISPAPVAPDSPVDAGEYLESWLAPVREIGLPVRAVLGFCLGGVYGAALADGVARFQGSPPDLILLDPEQTQLVTIQYQLTKVLTMLNTVLAEAEIAEIHAKLGELASVEDISVRRYSREMFGEFRRFTNGAFERAGLDPGYGQEMLELFSAFLSYLSIAEDLDPRPAWLGATALSSTSPDSGLNRLRRTGEMGTGPLVSDEIGFAEEHTELLRSSEVAQTVDKLLER
ncbi:hypothetical protein [Micromonospora sp. NPDC049274]|uniref:hypothetical protein n=1 Tax=Micromonospora sp. NPDC049274 TaxID=3154829 RepID=UPI00342D8E0B